MQVTMLILTCGILVLLIAAQDGLALNIKNFDVPLHVHRGEDATLRCEYDMEGAQLYSIKWYRNGREFYRYVPTEVPIRQTFNVSGIKVDMEASNGQIVVLKNVVLSTSGWYKCEVLAEAPDFDTMVKYGILAVIEIPEEKPVMLGGKERYRPGDIVRLNCTSAYSKPAALLTWFINGKEAPEKYLIRYKTLLNEDFLEQSTVGLHFQATHDHFPNSIMSLRCTAIITFYKTTAENMRNTPLSLLSREHTYDLPEIVEEEDPQIDESTTSMDDEVDWTQTEAPGQNEEIEEETEDEDK